MALLEDFATEFQTTVSSTIGPTDTTFNLTTTSGLPASPSNTMLRIEPAGGSTTQYELVHVVVASGTTVTTVGTRAAAQEQTSGQTWAVGSLVSQVVTRNGLVNAFLAFGEGKTALVANSDTQGVSGYADLANVGPSVTIATGTQALVGIYADITNTTLGAKAFMGFAISGATTLAAANNYSIMYNVVNANWEARQSGIFFVSLTAGSNTFTAKYGTTIGGTSTFADRRLWVLPI